MLPGSTEMSESTHNTVGTGVGSGFGAGSIATRRAGYYQYEFSYCSDEKVIWIKQIGLRGEIEYMAVPKAVLPKLHELVVQHADLPSKP